MNSTAVTASCIPGTNSTAFQNATLRRINWLRAMGGIPAAITFDFERIHAGPGRRAHHVSQQHASAYRHTAHVELFHHCRHQRRGHTRISPSVPMAPDAITGYIWDFGANNYEVGHRRWILYPQTQVMAAGDVPAEGGFNCGKCDLGF